MRYFVGLDLAETQDYTAVSVLDRHVPTVEDSHVVVTGNVVVDRRLGLPRRETFRRATGPATFALVYQERFNGRAYPWIVQHVQKLMRSPELNAKAKLVVDSTGVGRPVYQMLRDAHLEPVGLTIHGGDQVTWAGGIARVPKRDLVGAVQVILQSDRLAFANGLPHLEVLKAELQNFRVKIDPVTSHDSYAAWREGDHDDMVLALAVAAWYAQAEHLWQPVGYPSRGSVTYADGGFGQMIRLGA